MVVKTATVQQVAEVAVPEPEESNARVFLSTSPELLIVDFLRPYSNLRHIDDRCPNKAKINDYYFSLSLYIYAIIYYIDLRSMTIIYTYNGHAA